MGKITAGSFAGAWHEREAAGEDDAEFAKMLGDAGKIVVSSQLLEFIWRNSEQLQGDLVESVTAVKNEPGSNIGISGSVSVFRLLAAALVDELTCSSTRSPCARGDGCSTAASPFRCGCSPRTRSRSAY